MYINPDRLNKMKRVVAEMHDLLQKNPKFFTVHDLCLLETLSGGAANQAHHMVEERDWVTYTMESAPKQTQNGQNALANSNQTSNSNKTDEPVDKERITRIVRYLTGNPRAKV